MSNRRAILADIEKHKLVHHKGHDVVALSGRGTKSRVEVNVIENTQIELPIEPVEVEVEPLVLDATTEESTVVDTVEPEVETTPEETPVDTDTSSTDTKSKKRGKKSTASDTTE
jgi:hypothetical protein